MTTKRIPDQSPSDDGKANLTARNTTGDLGRGNIKKGAAYSNSRRRTGRVGGINPSANIVGEDTKNVPGLNRT